MKYKLVLMHRHKLVPMDRDYKKIACHHLIVDCRPIPYSPCVVQYNSKSRRVVSYEHLAMEQSHTEWVSGTLEIKNGEILI